jgi:putative heme transporter
MLATDVLVLLLCLRFVGIYPSDVNLADVAIAYLFAYPFTLFPFSGIGVVDALILAALVESGGIDVESAAVAALVVWRVFTVGVPVLMGGGAVGLWRRSVASQTREDGSSA